MSAAATGERWTYGVELEWPDVDTHAVLPPGWGWSSQDYTVVNSNAVANDPCPDPGRRLVRYGGELNSPAYPSPEALEEGVAVLWDLLRPGHNYRSNLHVHVGVPGLAQDLGAVLGLCAYTRQHLPGLLERIDPLEGLLDGVPPGEQLAGARRRLRHSQRSRHYFVPRERHLARMAAPDVRAALLAEYPRRADGSPLYQFGVREAVNVQSLRKHGTVEFRHFAAPRNPFQVLRAAQWAQGWLLAAWAGTPPPPVPPGLPRQEPYQHALECGWRATSLGRHKRAAVAATLEQMGLTGCV